MFFVVKKIIYMFCTEHVVKHFFYYFEVLIKVVQVNHGHSNIEIMAKTVLENCQKIFPHLPLLIK